MVTKNIAYVMATIARLNLETLFAIIKLMHILVMQGDTPFDEKIVPIESNGFLTLAEARKGLNQLYQWGYIDYTTSSQKGRMYTANNEALRKVLRYFNKRLSFLPLYKDA